jgi:hypothetical protein
MSDTALTVHERLQALREAGAAQRDAVGWHYLQALSERVSRQHGAARQLLLDKLLQALDELQARLQAAAPPTAPPAQDRGLSPLGTLLHEMTQHHGGPTVTETGRTPHWRTETSRVQQFRQQLRHISVHKQVSQAIAQGPSNAGPINSHMLVLRALGLMRERSPAYLDRFMSHLDTLLCLEEAEKSRHALRKTSTAKSRKN